MKLLAKFSLNMILNTYTCTTLYSTLNLWSVLVVNKKDLLCQTKTLESQKYLWYCFCHCFVFNVYRPKVAVNGIKRKIGAENPHVSLYALQVSDIFQVQTKWMYSETVVISWSHVFATLSLLIFRQVWNFCCTI